MILLQSVKLFALAWALRLCLLGWVFVWTGVGWAGMTQSVSSLSCELCSVSVCVDLQWTLQLDMPIELSHRDLCYYANKLAQL